MHWVEYIGFVGVALVLVSFIITGEKRIRLVNIVGASVNLIYSILALTLLEAPVIAVIILNGALIPIHLFYLLRRTKNTKKNLEQTRI